MIYEGKVILTRLDYELVAECLTYLEPDQFKSYQAASSYIQLLRTDITFLAIYNQIFERCRECFDQIPLSHFKHCPESAVLNPPAA